MNFQKLFAAIALLTILWLSTAATYYIDVTNGSDGNNGTTPVAGTTNGPWKTIAKYMRTNGVSGDTAYMMGGVYREAITPLITSPTATTKLIGDPQNTRGFKTSGGVLVTPAIVRWTNVTNDLFTTGASTGPLILNGQDYWWFENVFINGAGTVTFPVDGTTTTSTNIVFTNCVISAVTPGQLPMSMTAAFGIPLNLRISNCKIVAMTGIALRITHTSGTGSDWDMNVIIENSEIDSPASTGIQFLKGGTSKNVGGGLRATNCSIKATTCIISTASSTNNFTNYVTACFLAGLTALSAGDTSQISEDYNWINANTDRVSTNTGTHSKTSLNPIIDCDMSRMFGFGPRPFWSPNIASPMIGLGTTAENVDLFGKTRPSPNTMGAYETYGNVETSHSFAQ